MTQGPSSPMGARKSLSLISAQLLRYCVANFNLGPNCVGLEQAVAAKVGARHAVAVNSATSALHIACLALGLGPEICFGPSDYLCCIGKLWSLLRC